MGKRDFCARKFLVRVVNWLERRLSAETGVHYPVGPTSGSNFDFGYRL